MKEGGYKTLDVHQTTICKKCKKIGISPPQAEASRWCPASATGGGQFSNRGHSMEVIYSDFDEGDDCRDRREVKRQNKEIRVAHQLRAKTLN